jgi:hypothetical protein
MTIAQHILHALSLPFRGSDDRAIEQCTLFYYLPLWVPEPTIRRTVGELRRAGKVETIDRNGPCRGPRIRLVASVPQL